MTPVMKENPFINSVHPQVHFEAPLIKVSMNEQSVKMKKSHPKLPPVTEI